VPKLWRPLQARLAGKPFPSITTDIPSDPLERKLREWIEESISGQEDVVHRIAVRFDMGDALDDETYLWNDVYFGDLYDVIDAVLDLGWGDTNALQALLDDALSVYTVAPDGEGLVTRADPTATAALTESVKTAKSRNDAGSAADHLTAAWGAAYALKPDEVRAYSESIKAVEAAAHSVIQPENSRATLGTMLRKMREHPGDFCLMLPTPGVEVTAVIAMMAVLWEGQTSRHGGQVPTRSETIEEARAAVQLAVALVHWFGNGTVRRTATSP
jgi:hypothetical protein